MVKVVGDADILRCVVKHLIYKPPDYKASTDCQVCKLNKVQLCERIIKALNE